jgi:trigger factor
VESISAGYEHPDEVVKYYYSDKQRLGEIENLVLEDEVVSWILSNVKIIEKPVSFSELMNKMG